MTFSRRSLYPYPAIHLLESLPFPPKSIFFCPSGWRQSDPLAFDLSHTAAHAQCGISSILKGGSRSHIRTIRAIRAMDLFNLLFSSCARAIRLELPADIKVPGYSFPPLFSLKGSMERVRSLQSLVSSHSCQSIRALDHFFNFSSFPSLFFLHL